MFVALALGLLAAMVAEAQPASRVWRVGFLGDGPRAERAPISIEPFRDGLRELGYVENQNVLIVERWSGCRSERLPWPGRRVGSVDVIVTHGVRAIRQAATR
jgi:putative ABC transport system substrate-binding protein